MFRANYLIRFDDISPYMNWDVWSEVEFMLDRYDIRPIVAIVPDCKDESIMVDSHHGDFWRKVREWESKGWSIALHGYQHKFVTYDPGIVGINHYSEFSGLDAKDQERKIDQGLKIFKENNCQKPHIWVAPAHSFDLTTIDVLAKFGINYISDSFALYPHSNKSIFWIPQQLWQFRKLPFGLWTVCLHHNRWTQSDLELFEERLKLFQRNITNVESVVRQYKTRRMSFFDRIFSVLFAKLVYLKRWIRAAL